MKVLAELIANYEISVATGDPRRCNRKSVEVYICCTLPIVEGWKGGRL
jgi:hypothetical protein